MCKSLEVIGTEGNSKYMFGGEGRGRGQKREMNLQRNTRNLGLILKIMKND